MRDGRLNYVDAAAWADVVAAAFPWCRLCRAGCLAHPVAPDEVEQLLPDLPAPAEDATTASAATV